MHVIKFSALFFLCLRWLLCASQFSSPGHCLCLILVTSWWCQQLTTTPQGLRLMRLCSTLGAGVGTFPEVSTAMFQPWCSIIGVSGLDFSEMFSAAMCPAAALHVNLYPTSRWQQGCARRSSPSHQTFFSSSSLQQGCSLV